MIKFCEKNGGWKVVVSSWDLFKYNIIENINKNKLTYYLIVMKFKWFTLKFYAIQTWVSQFFCWVSEKNFIWDFLHLYVTHNWLNICKSYLMAWELGMCIFVSILVCFCIRYYYILEWTEFPICNELLFSGSKFRVAGILLGSWGTFCILSIVFEQKKRKHTERRRKSNETFFEKTSISL